MSNMSVKHPSIHKVSTTSSWHVLRNSHSGIKAWILLLCPTRVGAMSCTFPCLTLCTCPCLTCVWHEYGCVSKLFAFPWLPILLYVASSTKRLIYYHARGACSISIPLLLSLVLRIYQYNIVNFIFIPWDSNKKILSYVKEIRVLWCCSFLKYFKKNM